MPRRFVTGGIGDQENNISEDPGLRVFLPRRILLNSCLSC
jgi:hypothetical protein